MACDFIRIGENQVRRVAIAALRPLSQARDFSGADHSRMQELMDKSTEGTLTSDENAELDSYVNIANVLSVMHSRARVALRYSGFEGSRDDRIL